MESENVIIGFFVLVFLLSATMVFFSFYIGSQSLTGFATTGSTTSNVTISKYLSISLSANLSNGVQFGSVSALPVSDLNASANHNFQGHNSTYFVNVSTDSNTAVDFCLSANTHLIDSSGGNTLGLGNETYQNASMAINNLTFPGPPGTSVPFTTSYVKASAPTGPGNVTYYRFWLDVPSAQPSGTYNNSILIEGVETTLGC